MSTNLFTASRQWASRPTEERFLSLPELSSKLHAQKAVSRAIVTSSRSVRAVPTEDNRGLVIEGNASRAYAPTHWSFGQLASLVGAPAGYLRSLPAPVAADCINYGLQVERDAQDIGILISADGAPQLRAATGPNYGRIWNADVVDALIDRFGDGVTGDFKVPGEFKRDVVVTRENTTIYGSDRDIFVFLADEKNRIELPNRRGGETGLLARGFFVSNSEVGSATLKIKTFLFDYVCCNRIVWGAHELDEISIRHTASAPDRFVERVIPVLEAYSNSAASNVQDVLVNAQQRKIDKVDAFLAQRFGPRVAQRIQAAHVADEARPIESLWDVVTGVTAYARGIDYSAERVALEEQAGDLLELV